MKNLIFLILLLFSLNSVATELTSLTKNCINEYNKTSKVKLDSTNLNLAYIPAGSNWRMIVGHNVIVPITSFKNSTKYSNGISSNNIPDYFVQNGLEGKVDKFTKKIGTVIESNEIISKSENSIVFGRLENVQNSIINGNTYFVPIDKNKNGRIDYSESIYGNLNDFLRGVWVGKYPSELTDDIYIVSDKIPTANETMFLTWLMNDGKNLLNSNGYSDIMSSEKNSNISFLTPATEIDSPYQYRNIFETKGMEYLIIITFFLLLIPFWYLLNKKSKETKLVALTYNSLKIPRGIFYAQNHTWTYLDKIGIAKVGIDDLIARIVGDVEVKFLKMSGEFIHKGELVAELVQQNKSLKIYSPISGEIMKINSSLDENNLLNTEPYDGGWLLKIEPNDWMHDIYKYKFLENSKYWIRTEFERFKNFVSNQSLVLQDGGELTDNVLEKSSNEIWKEFENKFMNID